jgi:signal transduction histidine kinase
MNRDYANAQLALAQANLALQQREAELGKTVAQLFQTNAELKQAGVQLLQTEKMASIGQLAAGVAHELNNPIGFINSNLGTLDHYLGELFAIIDAYADAESAAPPGFQQLERAGALKREKDYEYLRSDTLQLLVESKDGLARVARITKDLKDFARAGEGEWQLADLHAGIDATVNIVCTQLKYKCTLIKAYGEMPLTRCMPAHINQVFMNLLVNACQAMPEMGNVTIRTGHHGDQVFVAISDTGNGVAAENMNRIFEPFFTTKPVGKGTGLGLSLAYSIVQQHGGRINVDSVIGKGATFTVWLPINADTRESAVTNGPTSALEGAGSS